MTKALQPVLVFFTVGVALLLAALLFQMAAVTTTTTTTFNLDCILERPHAINQHGRQAIQARRTIFSCGTGLRVYYSQIRGTYLLVCPLEESHVFCAGMVVGGRMMSDGKSLPEITAFVPLCAYWDGVIIRDGYLTY